MADLSITIGAGVMLTVLLAFVYRRAWRGERTPTGFGALLAPAMLAAVWLGGASGVLIASLALTTIATAVYWFDDLLEMSARSRVFISFATGAAIGAIYGSAVPLARELAEPWQGVVLVAAALALLALRSG